ncbi:MAG: hypothetical protein ACRELF_06240 [Gemmataceae bacterium]
MVIDVNGPRSPITVQLPAELIEEIRTLAREKQVSVDDVVMEACFAYTEPYFWERSYKEWRKENPNEPLHEFGINGEEMLPSGPAKD